MVELGCVDALNLDGGGSTTIQMCIRDRRNTGARGLRSIIEEAMSDIMFEVPSDDSIKTVIITKKCITDLKEPKIIHETKETKKLKENLEPDGTQG